jgi:hypothetical protein
LPLDISHNIDPALSAICTTTFDHAQDDTHLINGVHSLASLDLGLGPHSPEFTCQWGDCQETFQSRADLLNHLHTVHLRADVIQAHKRATLDPPPYHRYLNPNLPLTPNLRCDWEHCHEELTPFKAPGPSNLTGFDASLRALSNHVFYEHFGLDPYGQYSFNIQQPLSAHQPYSYQQQHHQGTLFNPNGITPPQWPIQEGREWWNAPKAVDYTQSNEACHEHWPNVSQSSTWVENSPNHGRIERKSTTRYDPYPASCRTTSAMRPSQSKSQAQLQNTASPKTTLRKGSPSAQFNTVGTGLGTSEATSNGVSLSASAAGLVSSGQFCCHWTGCSEAGFDFGSSDSLTAHITAQHVGSGKKTYDCFWDGCDRNGEKSFPSKQKILRHLQVCCHCHITFAPPSNE